MAEITPTSTVTIMPTATSTATPTATPISTTAQDDMNTWEKTGKIEMNGSGCYFGLYPGISPTKMRKVSITAFRESMDHVIDVTGVSPSMISSFDQWSDHWQWHPFSRTAVEEAGKYGGIPMITWEPSGLPFQYMDDSKQYLDEMIDQLFVGELRKRLQEKYAGIYADIIKGGQLAQDRKAFIEFSLNKIVEDIQKEFGSAGFSVEDKQKLINRVIVQLRSQDGEICSYVRKWAQDARAYGKEFLLRPFHEMNLEGEDDRYPWTVKYNDPEKIKTAWRLLHTVFKEEGTTNAKFVWCIQKLDLSAQELDDLREGKLNTHSIEGLRAIKSIDLAHRLNPNYDEKGNYVGDYMDMVGVDGYGRNCNQIFLPALWYLEKTGKPIAICETSAPPDEFRAKYIEDLFALVRMFGIKAVIWFNENKSGRGIATEDNWCIDAQLRIGPAGKLYDNLYSIGTYEDQLHLAANDVQKMNIRQNIKDRTNENEFISGIMKMYDSLFMEKNESKKEKIRKEIRGEIVKYKKDAENKRRKFVFDEELYKNENMYLNDALRNFRKIKSVKDGGNFIFRRAEIKVNPLGLNDKPEDITVPKKEKEDLEADEKHLQSYESLGRYLFPLPGAEDKLENETAATKEALSGYLEQSEKNSLTRRNVKLQIDDKFREAIRELRTRGPLSREFLKGLDRLKGIYAKWEDTPGAKIVALKMAETLYNMAKDDRYTEGSVNWYLHPFAWFRNNSDETRGQAVIPAPELKTWFDRQLYYLRNIEDGTMYKYPERRGFMASALATKGLVYMEAQKELRKKAKAEAEKAAPPAPVASDQAEDKDEIAQEIKDMDDALMSLCEAERIYEGGESGQPGVFGGEFARPRLFDAMESKLSYLLESRTYKNERWFPFVKPFANIIYKGPWLIPGVQNDNLYLYRSIDVNILYTRAQQAAMGAQQAEMEGKKDEMERNEKVFKLCTYNLAHIARGERYMVLYRKVVKRDDGTTSFSESLVQRSEVVIPGIQIQAEYALARLLQAGTVGKKAIDVKSQEFVSNYERARKSSILFGSLASTEYSYQAGKGCEALGKSLESLRKLISNSQ